MSFHIQPLTPELLPDWLNFFDNIAFVDNPDWSNCYCCCYQLSWSNDEWDKRTKEQNRESSQEFIKSGEMKGYLAFEGSSPVGWCNVNDFSSFYRISKSDEISSIKREEKTAAISCFIIAASHRRKGLARKLLLQAIDGCRIQGFESLEAYPRLGDHLSPCDQFQGPMALYQSEGFEIKKSFDKYAIVAKNIK